MASTKKNLNATQSDLQIVQNYISRGELKDALIALDELSKRYPKDANLFFLGGTCYGHLGHREQAFLCFEEAIKIKPDFAEAHNNYGFYLKDENEISKALSHHKKAIKIKPDYAEAHNNLGICLFELSRPNEALSHYERAIKIKPDYAEAHNNLGNVLKELGQISDAILSYKKAMNLRPDFQFVFSNLAACYADLGQADEANKLFSKARGDNKDYEQGILLMKKKYYSKAIVSFKASRFLDWQEKVIECYYRNKDFNRFEEKIVAIKEKNCLPFLATLSAHYAQNFKVSDPYNFCPSPLKFVHHEQIPELMENDQQLVKEVVKDISTADILQKYQGSFNGTAGQQSSGHLFRRPEQSFAKLSDALIKSIKKYFLQFKNEDNEFIRLFPSNISFDNAWFVKMQSGGYLTPHIHEKGWISGAVYLEMPKNSGVDGQDGAIELSSDGAGYPKLHDDFEKKIILPNVGDVIFFPSSVFHRTIPFNSDEERICVAFDVKPA